VPMCTLSGFPTLFTSDNSSTNLQVSEIHTWIWDLVGFSNADFVGCGIDRKTLLVHPIFLDLPLFVGQLTNSHLSHNPP
jgi:hypothetical protein